MNRAQMLYALDDIIEIVKSSKLKETEPAYFIPQVKDLSDDDKMNAEFDHLGFFISNHPLDAYRIKLSQLQTVGSMAEKEQGTPVHLGGLMMNIIIKQTKKGATMAFFTLEDVSGRCEVIVFPRTYQKLKHLFETKNQVVEISGKLERQVREFDGNEVVTNKIILMNLQPMEHAKKIEKVSLCIMDGDRLDEIKELLGDHPGDVEVEIEYSFAVMKTPIKVDQTRNFLMDLEAMCNIKRYYA